MKSTITGLKLRCNNRMRKGSLEKTIKLLKDFFVKATVSVPGLDFIMFSLFTSADEIDQLSG